MFGHYSLLSNASKKREVTISINALFRTCSFKTPWLK
ncbi:hypothetical protein EVA_17199 [gut metagenome]|uniref:Uncharacterized protein n=1 Tax=gut metagenome TaxID=749906 RepID=J9G5A7_9ZZZZ